VERALASGDTNTTHSPEQLAALLDELGIRYETDVPIGKDMTWFAVGGSAQVLAHPAGTAQLSALVARSHQQAVPVYVLGSGANLLIRDEGVQGIVIRLDDPSFSQLKIDGTRIIAGPGLDLFKLVLESAKAGLAGLAHVAGIPASVGGAIRMNAGGAFGDIGSTVYKVHVMAENGQVYCRDRDDLVFGYRTTNIVAPYILDVEFDMDQADPQDVARRVKEIFLYKKNTQPMAENSAGCAFKNPTIITPGYEPDADADDGPPPPTQRVSAGKLIDEAGLKGHRVGGAEVSQRHANFIFTHPGCTANDVLTLMEHIQQTVLDHSGVALQREVVVWP
jgi:UDP-N-acetylmuramate dehydrogenase